MSHKRPHRQCWRPWCHPWHLHMGPRGDEPMAMCKGVPDLRKRDVTPVPMTNDELIKLIEEYGNECCHGGMGYTSTREDELLDRIREELKELRRTDEE